MIAPLIATNFSNVLAALLGEKRQRKQTELNKRVGDDSDYYYFRYDRYTSDRGYYIGSRYGSAAAAASLSRGDYGPFGYSDRSSSAAAAAAADETRGKGYKNQVTGTNAAMGRGIVGNLVNTVDKLTGSIVL